MQVAASMGWRRWSPRGLVGLAIALAAICGWVAALLALMTSNGYDAAAPVLLGPIFVALSIPAFIAQARREGSNVLVWVLLAALVLKLASSVARHYVAFDLYSGFSDAVQFHEEGLRLRTQFLAGNFDTGLSSLTSTNFIRFLTGIVYTIIGPSRLGGFMAFSWLGFWGQFLFYRAFTVAVPEGRRRTYARLVFFLPSLLFWPSGIGKEAWMLFALGIVAYGAARMLSGSTLRGLAGAGLGLWLAAAVRPTSRGWPASRSRAPTCLDPRRWSFGELAPIVKVLSFALLAGAAVLLIARTDTFLEQSGIDTSVGVGSVVEGRAGTYRRGRVGVRALPDSRITPARPGRDRHCLVPTIDLRGPQRPDTAHRDRGNVPHPAVARQDPVGDRRPQELEAATLRRLRAPVRGHVRGRVLGGGQLRPAGARARATAAVLPRAVLDPTSKGASDDERTSPARRMDDEDDPADEHRSHVAHAGARGGAGAGIGGGRARAPLPRGEGERAREDAGDPPGGRTGERRRRPRRVPRGASRRGRTVHRPGPRASAPGCGGRGGSDPGRGERRGRARPRRGAGDAGGGPGGRRRSSSRALGPRRSGSWQDSSAQIDVTRCPIRRCFATSSSATSRSCRAGSRAR